MKLVIGERKSLNVLIYLVLIPMAYFGPNAELLGNIRLSIWQFQRPIEDIEAYLFRVTLLLGADLLSVVINAGMLWYFCKINLLTMLKKLQKSFWHVFAIADAFIITEVNLYDNAICLVYLIYLFDILDFCPIVCRNCI